VIKLSMAAQHRFVIPRPVGLVQPDKHLGLQPRELKGICQRPLDRAAPFSLWQQIVVRAAPVMTGQRLGTVLLPGGLNP
jgi:hypothetical protein